MSPRRRSRRATWRRPVSRPIEADETPQASLWTPEWSRPVEYKSGFTGGAAANQFVIQASPPGSIQRWTIRIPPQQNAHDNADYNTVRVCVRSHRAAPDQTIDNALCVWFVTGAIEVIVNNRSYGFSVCPPHVINSAQAVKLTRLWLAAHPDQEVRAGSYAVAAAVADAFSCKK
jgi:Ssp1 endopeptidase immunity protein Rap1a